MTPAAALRPNERLCPDCDSGYITVEITGPTDSASTGPNVLGTKREVCERCDGTGVIVNDRRESTREPGPAWTDFERTANALTLETAENVRLRGVVAHQADQIDRLIRENASLRTIVHTQSIRLHLPTKPSSPTSTLPISIRAGEGLSREPSSFDGGSQFDECERTARRTS